ncbi:MAG TPA: glycosyltransferase [Chroococcidiopsis sp.]
MKIAIISSGFLPVVDGVTVTLLNRLRQLSQLGHEVLVFCPDYSTLASIYPNWRDYQGDILPGVRVVNLPSTSFMGISFERNVSKASYDIVLRQLAQFQPDVIHVDEPDRLFLGFDKIPGIDYAKAHKIPCFGFYHTNFLDYMDDFLPLPRWAIAPLKELARRWITCRVFNAYDATIVSGPITYQKVLKIGINNAVNADVLGVDSDQFSPDLRSPHFFEQRYGLPSLDAKIKLLFLGRLTPDKGWKFTLKALPLLAQAVDCQGIAIVVAGDGDMARAIAKGLAKLPIESHLLGRIAPAEVPALLANSDIHITASTKETKGLTVLEAFASGIPVIAPKSGGVIDSIQPGVNGLLFAPGDRSAFVQAIATLVQDADLRSEMGRNGRAYAAHYDWRQASDRLLEIWQNPGPS